MKTRRPVCACASCATLPAPTPRSFSAGSLRALSSVRPPWLWAGLPLLPLGCAVLFVFDPARSALFPPCPFKLATGLDCPGCGTLRGLHEMLRGNPATAFGLNPVSMAVLLLAAGFVVWSASRIVRGRPRLRVSPPAWAPWAAGALIVAYGVARNLPFAPLSWMASG